MDSEKMKQYIRLADVFFVAPVMIYAGTNAMLPFWLRASLIATGAATLVYNGVNYINIKDKLKENAKSA